LFTFVLERVGFILFCWVVFGWLLGAVGLWVFVDCYIGLGVWWLPGVLLDY